MKKPFIIAFTVEAVALLISYVGVPVFPVISLWLHAPGITVSALLTSAWRPLCVAWCKMMNQTPADWVWFFPSSIPGEPVVMNLLVLFLVLLGIRLVARRCGKQIVISVAVTALLAFAAGAIVSSRLVLRGRGTPARTPEAERVKQTFDRVCPVGSFVEGVAYDTWGIDGVPPPGLKFIVDVGAASGISFATYATGLSLLVILLYTRRTAKGPTSTSNATP